MSLSLPAPIATFFEISNGKGVDRVSQCFTPEAIVVDEGIVYEGAMAIEGWQMTSQAKTRYTVEPISDVRDDVQHTVVATVAGDFPGSPVRLTHVFILAGDQIQSLKIT